MRVIALVFLLLSSCSRSPAPAPVAREAPTDGWDGRGAFTFSMTDFHFELGGTQILQIDSAGLLQDLFVEHRATPVAEYCADAGVDKAEACASLKRSGSATVTVPHWHLAHIALAPAEVEELRRALTAAHLATLKREDQGATYPDGTTRTWVLKTERAVDWVSRYEMGPPAELEPVLKRIAALVGAHPEARKDAPEPTPAQRAALERSAKIR